MNVKLPEAFKELFDPHRYKVYYSGRGAAKSHSFAGGLLILGANRPLRILCAREFQSSIKDSVKSLLDDKIKDMGLEWFYDSTRDGIEGLNGTQFIFAGLKTNITKIKSLEAIDIVWIEEAHSVSQESWDILIPTIRAEDSEIWASFNPYKEDDPVYKMFVKEGRPDAIVKKVSWRDNPFFPNVLKKEMEYDKKHDLDKYLHIWEGECLRISDAAVFKGKLEVASFEAPEDAVFYLGLDPGFSQDYLAFIRCYIDDKTNRLYIDKAARKIQLEIDDTPRFLTQVIPGCQDWMITCDSARPELISYLRNKGFTIQSAKKGAGSVLEGVKFLQNYTIVIHERLKDVIEEFSNYQYKIDSHTGQILPKLQEGNDHYVDALRYSVEDYNRRDYTLVVPGE
jgi:phage terminase large subunit